MKSCKEHVKSSRKLKKNIHIEDFQDYFSLCEQRFIGSINKSTIVC